MNNKIDVDRFLKKIDSCFNKNDLDGAGECLNFWESEARSASDDRALLTILNEYLGFCRRVNNKEKAISSIDECKLLIEKLGISKNNGAATICINAATTYAHFGYLEEGLMLYDKAKKIYIELDKKDTYEYATLLNNSAGVLNILKRYDEAEKNYLEATEILKRIGNHDAEIALSLVMLAHINFDKSENPDSYTYEKVESLLEESIKHITSDKIVRDGNFAFILSKIAPSFEYFKRPGYAKEMRELSKKIYSSNDCSM